MLMEQYQAVWGRCATSEEVPIFGFRFDVGLEPVGVDRTRMISRFRTGVDNLTEIWEAVFAPSDMVALRRLAHTPEEAFHLDDDLWVRLVYDVACAFHHRVVDRGQLVRSMLPLYMAWVASFVGRVHHSTAAEVDATIEHLCQAFEAQKDYLLTRWSHPDGPRPPGGRPASIEPAVDAQA